jgi:glutamate-ammonia-ligase adenylyltransferase
MSKKSDIKKYIFSQEQDLEQSQLERYLSMVPEDLFSNLKEDQVLWIVRNLASIEPGNPLSIQFWTNNNSFECISVSYDYEGLFIHTSGLLSAHALSIETGKIRTSYATEGRALAINLITGTYQENSDTLQSINQAILDVTDKIEFISKKLEENTDQSKKEAREIVLIEAARAMQVLDLESEAVLSPVEFDIEALSENQFHVTVVSKDTVFFLFSLSTALGLNGLSINEINITTTKDEIRDELVVSSKSGKTQSEDQWKNQLSLSILLAKQFTFSLPQAPDPRKALSRFDELIEKFIQDSKENSFLEIISSPRIHKDLAKLLGTSDFIWEDFVRVQQDSIIPMIPQLNDNKLLSLDPDDLEKELRQKISVEKTLEKKTEILNSFKNQQSFLIDLDHILLKSEDFFFLSQRLSRLGEAVCRVAMDLAYEEIKSKYGDPISAAGIVADWSLLGLGKLGGSALGYASDIELLFVFSDNGQTNGAKSIANRDFFEKLIRKAVSLIISRREGIFHVDMRLRPFGIDGPMAVKLESFLEYFQRGGKAHSVERLALVRLRHLAGSKSFGKQIEQLRDEIIYESDSISIEDIRELRLKQFDAKVKDRGANAKFSPGGLVDLEYNVQVLQIIHGRENQKLRTPKIHEALHYLNEQGTINAEEAGQMVECYQFMRRLINGLRMLRGNAQDLFLPEERSMEYRYLARRMGYTTKEGLVEEAQLQIDFATYSTAIKKFVEKYLGREAIPLSKEGSVSDLILRDSLSPEHINRVLDSANIKDKARAMVNLRHLAASGEQRELFAQLLILSWHMIRKTPDVDMIFNNWEQLIRGIRDVPTHYRQLISQPKRAELLFLLFSSSQFLANTLIQNPGFFSWITDPLVVRSPRTQIQMEDDLLKEAKIASDRIDWLNRLRRFRRREILRIGLRDLGLGIKITEIMGEISFLARACTEIALSVAWERNNPHNQAKGNDQNLPQLNQLIIFGFGKLGGWELNYSSDIDIMAVFKPAADERSDAEIKIFTQVFQELIQDLADFTAEGQAYRVDLRLRPHGNSGPIVSTFASASNYYRERADLWEHQALLKVKPIAGNLSLGEELLDEIKPAILNRWSDADIRANIKKLRIMAVDQHTKKLGGRFDVKNGEGGIRDIEFLIQGLQLIAAKKHPEVLTGNTIKAMELLGYFSFLNEDLVRQLKENYIFLRSIEHYLQISEDKQMHALPGEDEELEKLARFVSPESKFVSFKRRIKAVQEEVRHNYEQFLEARL